MSVSITDVTSASASNVVGGSGHDLPSSDEAATAAVSTEEFAAAYNGDVSTAKDVVHLSEELMLSLSVVGLSDFITFPLSANKSYCFILFMISDNT
jgi:hypothetical protein